MGSRLLAVRDVVVAQLPQQNPQGHEQQGYRPAIVVGLPTRLGSPRFSVVIVAPLTTDRGQEWSSAAPNLYPQLSVGIGGLKSPSIVLLDQVRALDISRIVSFKGG